MRLEQKEINIIKKVIFQYFGKCDIYIFGSRINNNKKGGDIDLMITVKNYTTYNRLLAKVKLQQLLHKPIDLIIYKDGTSTIEKIALKGIKI